MSVSKSPQEILSSAGWGECLATHGWQVHQHEDGSMAIVGQCGCTGWLHESDWEMLAGRSCGRACRPPRGMTMAILLHLSEIM